MSKIKDNIKSQPRVFNKWVISRIRKNQNAIIIFNGGTGSGKSYAGIRCALDLSREMGTNFSIEKNLAFKFTDLLIKMGLPGNEHPGTIFVMEEVGSFGSGAASREWQSQANKFFFSFMQTSRHRNQVLLLNCPSFHYLEKGTRQLVHFLFSVTHIYYALIKRICKSQFVFLIIMPNFCRRKLESHTIKNLPNITVRVT